MIHLYLPIAGSSINAFLIFGMGAFVGLLSGIFGVGGGFLMTPLLIMIGIPPTVAAASDSNQIVGASTSGTIAHYRMGNVDFKMGILLLIGGVIGGTAGVEIIKILRGVGNAGLLIKMIYVLVLGFVGSYMFMESLQSMKRKESFQEWREKKKVLKEKEPLYSKLAKILPWQVYFEKSGVKLSILLPIFLGAFAGILAAIMGVGGGFIMVPFMVYFLRMPMHVVVGTSLFQILFTCISVTIMQAHINHTVDFILALLLLLGSSMGAQIGARISRKLKADQLKLLLASIILLVMIKMLLSLLLTPDIMITYKEEH